MDLPFSNKAIYKILVTSSLPWLESATLSFTIPSFFLFYKYQPLTEKPDYTLHDSGFQGWIFSRVNSNFCPVSEAPLSQVDPPVLVAWPLHPARVRVRIPTSGAALVHSGRGCFCSFCCPFWWKENFSRMGCLDGVHIRVSQLWMSTVTGKMCICNAIYINIYVYMCIYVLGKSWSKQYCNSVKSNICNFSPTCMGTHTCCHEHKNSFASCAAFCCEGLRGNLSLGWWKNGLIRRLRSWRGWASCQGKSSLPPQQGWNMKLVACYRLDKVVKNGDQHWLLEFF